MADEENPGGGAPDPNAGGQPDPAAAAAAAAAAGGEQPDPNAGGGAENPGGGQPDPNANVTIWGEGMDDELKQFVGDKTPAQIAKELKGAQSLLGKKTVGIPGKESTPEEWANFHKARGVPDQADGYDLTAVRDELLKDIPEDQREKFWDTDEEARFRDLAKKANLSTGEANELVKRELEHRLEQQRAQAEKTATENKTAQGLITQNWGPKTEEFTQDANNFARSIGMTEDVTDAIMKLDGVTGETRFKIVDAMRHLGRGLREGGQPGDTVPGAPNADAMTPDQARAAKTQYLATGDNRAAYQDSTHPNHKTVTAQMTKYLMAERGQTAK